MSEVKPVGANLTGASFTNSTHCSTVTPTGTLNGKGCIN
jgi:hypothetical protein